jgi:uncharacterized protein YaaN involved in tellurite resistance
VQHVSYSPYFLGAGIDDIARSLKKEKINLTNNNEWTEGGRRENKVFYP